MWRKFISGRTPYLQLGIPSTMNTFKTIKQEVKKSSLKTEYTSFAILKESLVEMIYDTVENTTSFAVYKNGEINYKQSITNGKIKLIPYSPDNNLLKNKVVLFPSRAEEYSSEAELLKDIQGFICRYVDLSPFFQKLSPYYVLFSWVYDCFNEVPYLRFIGDTGSGKSRAVETIGSLCYKPIFASGNASVSPIFRILDLFQGSLLIDEADYRFSDEKAEIIKILNCGNTRTFTVLRSESVKGKEFNPVSFKVFGPKILNTRNYFKDSALESRCITEIMDEKTLRDDVPINKPEGKFEQEALEIRNRLLMFRFKNYGKKKINSELVDKSIAPRLNQIIVPLASIVSDQKVLEKLKAFIQEYNKQLILNRGMELRADVLEAILKLRKTGKKTTMKNIAYELNVDWGYEDEKYRGKKFSPKYIGHIVRKDLKLQPQKTMNGYIIPESEKDKIDQLREKFGIKKELEEKTQKELQEEANRLAEDYPEEFEKKEIDINTLPL